MQDDFSLRITIMPPESASAVAADEELPPTQPFLKPTPLYRYPALDTLTGARVRVKHENHQPVGAFKVRGGVNLVSQLTADERRLAPLRAKLFAARAPRVTRQATISTDATTIPANTPNARFI